ncbi:response regulator transcription factor [Georgenia deserti]|uniref:Sensory transduction protein RegX3 n=1 Tax=Georgenia deserti TaxID=2093781 RepID=A0ABW4L8D1_9MICO
MQLLLVEDDEHVGNALESLLTKRGFEVVRARDGASALSALSPGTEMVLLDLGLPDMDGLDVLWRVRKVCDAPVIVVTGRTAVTDRVRGLELGADDYVTKPYDFREVRARIEAVLRRRRAEETITGPATGPLQVAGLTVDLATRVVSDGDGAPIVLTRKEFDLLAAIARRSGAVVARERLLHEVWGTGWRGLERSLEVHVASLRRKLGEREVVETVRGVGYRLADAVGPGDA